MNTWKWFVLDVTRWSVGALALIGVCFIGYYRWYVLLLVPAVIASIYGTLILGSFLFGMASELWKCLTSGEHQ